MQENGPQRSRAEVHLGNVGWCLFQPQAVLVGRLLAAESQFGMCMRRIEQKQYPRPRLTRGFRLLWVVLSKLLTGVAESAAATRGDRHLAEGELEKGASTV